MKKAREREQKKQEESSNVQVNKDKEVRFAEDQDKDFAFQQTNFFEETVSQQVTDFCKKKDTFSLAGVILLDSGSAVDMIQDKRLLRNAKQSERILLQM